MTRISGKPVNQMQIDRNTTALCMSLSFQSFFSAFPHWHRASCVSPKRHCPLTSWQCASSVTRTGMGVPQLACAFCYWPHSGSGLRHRCSNKRCAITSVHAVWLPHPPPHPPESHPKQ